MRKKLLTVWYTDLYINVIMNDKESIVADLVRLGVKSGDTLFLRVSYRALGKTVGGPQTFIDALLHVIGSEGTLVAAAFPKRQSSFYSLHKSFYEPGKNISTGVIPEFMSLHKDACFSSHPVAPFVCIGKNANLLTRMHTPEKHNFDLISKAIEISSPKCLRVGGHTLVGTTHIAFSEGLVKNRQFHLRKPEGIYYYDESGRRKFRYQDMSFFCKKGFEEFCEQHIYTNPAAVIGKGMIGQGEAILTNMRTTLAIEREWIVPKPQILLCNDPECLHCRSAYSYSDYSPFQFILQLIKMKLKGKYTRGHFFKDVKNNLILSFFGRECH